MVTEAEQAVDERQLVVFDLAGQRYGVDIGTVREIIRIPDITHVPDAPPSVEGMINLRGGVIPVVDLRKRFGLLVTEATAQSRVVVVEIGGDDIGVVVDAVAEVLRLSASSIERASMLVTTAESFYISGIAKVDEQLLILLDLEKALSSEALAKLVRRAEEAPAVAIVEETDAGEAETGEEAAPDTEGPEASEETGPAEAGDVAPDLDIELLETTFEAVAPRGEELVEYFYEQLFERYPDVQPLFAEVDMSEQRAKLLSALVTVVASLRHPEELAEHLEALGRRHAGYGVLPEHYAAVGEVLLDALASIAGDAWTPEAEQAWTDAYAVISGIMVEAALALEEEAAA